LLHTFINFLIMKITATQWIEISKFINYYYE
jgi:hypothetical protein